VKPEVYVKHVESDDPRLRRKVRHDPRSAQYAIEAKKLGQLKSVTHARHVPIYDQGQLGCCTAEAACGALSSAPFEHHISSQKSVHAFYHDETLLQSGGDPADTYPPADPGSDGLTAAKVAKQRGAISSYQHAFSLEAALTAIEQGPTLLGIWWRSGCDTPDSDGLVNYTGTVRGGHEILARQLVVEKKLVVIDNSWGTSWGIGGRFAMTWDDFGAALADEGDATLFIA
jgi:hypothetical protein